uniref:Peptidase S1 domain-containing protein n=1 Tax=Daphnia galeata TaxID=27404 RepID=A0A8J2RMQ3_9CRUS|nr:unnamed protein product [Daphnia galeata]
MAFHHSDSVSVLILSLFSLILLFLADKTHQKGPVQCGGRPNPLVNEFPWMAHLLIQNPSGKTFTCGRTLISDQHIITAAHCVVEDGTDKLFTLVNITLGSVDVNPHSNSAARYIIKMSTEKCWPSLKSTPIYWNTTLPSLYSRNRPFSTSKNCKLDYVQPACLPFAHDSDQVNDSVIFTGWGQQSTGVPQCCLRESSSVLRRWNTTVISSFGYDGQCQQTAAVGPFSGHNVICTDGSQQHRRFCYGDGGGPLNYYNSKLDSRKRKFRQQLSPDKEQQQSKPAQYFDSSP